jgi:hypothetical protein
MPKDMQDHYMEKLMKAQICRRNFLRLAGAGGVLLTAGLGSLDQVAWAAANGSTPVAFHDDLRLAKANGLEGAGTVERPDLKIGESWIYEDRDGYNHALKARWVGDIISIDDSRVDILVLDGHPGNDRRDVYGRQWDMISRSLPGERKVSFSPALLSLPFPLQPGKSWRQEIVVTDSFSGKRNKWKLFGKVHGWERVRVPAGEFDAIRIVRDLYLGDADWWRSETRRTERDWYAPEVKWIVKQEWAEEYEDLSGDSGRQNGDRLLRELVSFTVRS